MLDRPRVRWEFLEFKAQSFVVSPNCECFCLAYIGLLWEYYEEGGRRLPIAQDYGSIPWFKVLIVPAYARIGLVFFQDPEHHV